MAKYLVTDYCGEKLRRDAGRLELLYHLWRTSSLIYTHSRSLTKLCGRQEQIHMRFLKQEFNWKYSVGDTETRPDRLLSSTRLPWTGDPGTHFLYSAITMTWQASSFKDSGPVQATFSSPTCSGSPKWFTTWLSSVHPWCPSPHNRDQTNSVLWTRTPSFTWQKLVYLNIRGSDLAQISNLSLVN